MSHLISNTTLVRRDRLKQLQQREKSWFDLEFLKATAPDDRSRCIDLLKDSRSQLRQDLFALTQCGFKTGGFFVEFGATDGIELNNTYLMETHFGWTGILAEPARGWHDALKANRKCTIETRCVWHTTGETLAFTEAPRGENSGISTFVKSSRRLRGQNYKVETISLVDLLETHKAPAHIDYISIDTEGSEFDILNAFDFDRWTFGVMTVEHNHAPQREDIHALLTDKGYRRVLEDVSRFDDWYVQGNG
ncbi:FkbM family methyltransferase [Ruegeria sp. WL0004]|uniref:FkbM family methyltransferase n=1 Tax=Ruegeria marisflavi TaxID=2984152 RepID=A0ABT2WNT4_9RHOB|nr:FkbM family methyltransferase [Ruegeria sp. WL0004]MCU9837549.1 FkbM family methyltransferase [Ruegeria sp. WL0004]